MDDQIINDKTAKKAEKRKLYNELYQKRQQDKKEKILLKQKIKEDWSKQKTEIKEREIACKKDLQTKLTELKTKVKNKEITNKDGKNQFHVYKKQRIKQFYDERQVIINLSSEQMQKSFSFKFKRWFFGVGKEFNRVTWVRGMQIVKDFFIILILVAIMAGLFTLVDVLVGIIPHKS